MAVHLLQHFQDHHPVKALHEVVQFMLAHGLLFQYLSPSPPIVASPSAQDPKLVTGLGYVDTHWQPSKYSYTEYEQRHDKILLSPCGGAVLMAGGIVW